MVSEALITSHDGIAGTWLGPVTKGALTQDTVNNLERWEPWVRAEVYDFELFSRLSLRRQGNRFILRHLRTPAAFRSIVTMVRPTAGQFRRQLNLVNGYADLREDRTAEITAQIVSPIAFFTGIANLHPDRTRFTLELIWVALRLAGNVEHRFKHALACRRPLELSPQLQPMILTPGHGSLPSGHCTEAHIVAFVLNQLIRGNAAARRRWREQFMRLAARIAINRTVAGVHFPVDSVAGQLLGLTLGEYLLNRCGALPRYDSWTFDGPRFPAPRDFDWRDLYNALTGLRVAQPWAVLGPRTAADTSQPLRWLWRKARDEWNG
jgi:membrane-associated phospholipid phosphatase